MLTRGGIGAELARLNASAALGAYDVGEVANRNVSGLLLGISSPAVMDKIAIQAELLKRSGSEVLVSELPGRAVMELADIEQGMSVHEQAQLTAAGATALPTVCAAVLPLGFIRLRDGDVLRVTIRAMAALGASDWAVVGWCRSGMMLGESVIKWRIFDADKSLRFDDVRSVYLYRRTATVAADKAAALNSTKLQATIRVSGEEQPVGGDFAYLATMALGEIGGAGPEQTVCLYREPASSQGPEDVQVNLAGTDAAQWSVLFATYLQDPERATRKGAESVEEMLNRVRLLEARAPSMARQARHQGRLAGSAALASMARLRRSNVRGRR